MGQLKTKAQLDNYLLLEGKKKYYNNKTQGFDKFLKFYNFIAIVVKEVYFERTTFSKYTI
jgi:hypothetical protein